MKTKLHLLLAAAALSSAASAGAATITRDNSTDNLNLNTAWTGDVLPGTGDIATWDASSTLANTLATTAQTWGGLDISGAAGAVTITNTVNLVLDNSTDANTVFNVGANNFTWSGNSSFNINGAAGGVGVTAPGATFSGSSVVTLGGTGSKNWTTNGTSNGVTNVTFTGTLALRGAAIPAVGTSSTNYLAFGGGGGATAGANGTLIQTGAFALDTGDATSCGSFVLTHAFNGQSLRLSSLSGTGNIRSDWAGVTASADTTVTRGLEIDQAGDTVFAGSILGHNGSKIRRNVSIVKKGAGTLVFSKGSIGSQSGLVSVNFDIQGGTWQFGDGTTNPVFQSGTTWDTASTFVIGASGTVKVAANGAFAFNRKITGGTGLFEVSSGNVTLSADNSAFAGTTKVSGGSLIVGSATALGTSAVTVTGGALDLAGRTITNSVTLAGGSITNSAGTGIAVNNLALGTTGSVNTNGQTLTVSGALTGSGSITGNVTVNGTLAVGNSPGLISVTGDTTLSSATTSIFELGGLTRGTEYDALNVSGLLTLDGTLSVVTWNGFDTTTLTAGTSFDLLNWGTLNAAGFDVATDLDLSSLTLAGGLAWDTSAFLTDGTIAVTAVPEPSTYGLLGAGALAGVAFVRRRRKFAGKAA